MFRNKSYSKPIAGFTLVELMVVVAILSILATISFSYYHSAQIKSKIAVASKELRTLADAVEVYHVDFGSYPFTFPVSGYDEDRFVDEKVEGKTDSWKVSTINGNCPPSLAGDKGHWEEDALYEAVMKEYKVPPHMMALEWSLRGLVDPMGYFSDFPKDVFARIPNDWYAYRSNNSFAVRCLRELKRNQYYFFSVGPDAIIDNYAYFALFPLKPREKSKILQMIRDDQFHLMEDEFLRIYDSSNGLHSKGDIVHYGGGKD